MQEQDWKSALQKASCTPGDFVNGNIKVLRADEAEAILRSALAAQRARIAEKVKKKKGNSTRHDAAYEERYEGIDEFCKGFDEAIDSVLSLLTPTEEAV